MTTIPPVSPGVSSGGTPIQPAVASQTSGGANNDGLLQS